MQIVSTASPSRLASAALTLIIAAAAIACDDDDEIKKPADANVSSTFDAGADIGSSAALPGRSGPMNDVKRFSHPLGDPTLGKEVFRFETFGNEGFWTRVLALPQGLSEVTPLKLLQLGVGIDSERIPAAMLSVLSAELKTDLSVANAPMLNSAATTEMLLEASAILGLPAINVAAANGKLDINPTDVYAGESIGMSCALCHSVTDGSVYRPPVGARGGTVGKRVDGWGNHDLEFGKLIALGQASRAYYPTLALKLEANMGKSVSRRGVGANLISAQAPEAEVDAFLNDGELYPIGMFDDETDGNGAPMHNTPFFRTELSAPWGSEGAIHLLQNFSNQVYTKLMEPTDITTEGGKKFMSDRGGAAGLEIVSNYEKILLSLGVAKGGQNGYPFLARRTRLVNNTLTPTGVKTDLSAGAKIEDSPLGIRVDDGKLVAMNGYMETVRPIRGDKSDLEGIARGRIVFRTPVGATSCTDCHRDDQSLFVPQNLVPYNPTVELYQNVPARPNLWTGYTSELVALRPQSGLAPIRNAPGIFDDKLIIADPSNHDEPRASALPLLVDLSRRPVFLHDDSVPSLDVLLNPALRLPTDPHPFFVSDPTQRADVVKFLRSLDDERLK